MLQRIHDTLKWQWGKGVISCDLRPPNVIAFPKELLEEAKGGEVEDEMAAGVQNMNMEECQGDESDVQDWIRQNLEEAKELFPSLSPAKMESLFGHSLTMACV